MDNKRASGKGSGGIKKGKMTSGRRKALAAATALDKAGATLIIPPEKPPQTPIRDDAWKAATFDDIAAQAKIVAAKARIMAVAKTTYQKNKADHDRESAALFRIIYEANKPLPLFDQESSQVDPTKMSETKIQTTAVPMNPK